MQTLVVAFVFAFCVTLLVVRLRHKHLDVSGDRPAGVQKFHAGIVPRIGGLGVLAGLAAALAWSGWRGLVGVEVAWLGLAALPAFGAGLAEDLTVRSRTIAWHFYEKFRFFFVPSFHGLDGRDMSQGLLGMG